MKNVLVSAIASAVALIGFSVVPIFANEDDTQDTINGRSVLAIESALRDRGVVTSGIEEWGTLVRAWVPNADGGTSMLFFDADTLQRVLPSHN